MKTNCDLCTAYKNHEGKDISKSFFLLTCKIHDQPMIVLKAHRAELTDSEKIELQDIMYKRFIGKRLRGYMQTILNHWHDHII